MTRIRKHETVRREGITTVLTPEYCSVTYRKESFQQLAILRADTELFAFDVSEMEPIIRDAHRFPTWEPDWAMDPGPFEAWLDRDHTLRLLTRRCIMFTNGHVPSFRELKRMYRKIEERIRS